MEGLIPLMSPKVHLMASLFFLSTFSNFFSWSLVISDAIITEKVSLGSKDTYLRESGKGFNSNVRSAVCVPEEGGQKKEGGGNQSDHNFHLQSYCQHMSYYKHIHQAN